MLASASSSIADGVDQFADVAAIGGLRERLASVADPRSPRGLRHSLMSILLITVCALAAGKNGYTAIEGWANDAPASVLAALGVRFDPFLARHVCPDESTIRDTLSRIDPAQLSAAGSRHLLDLVEGLAKVRVDRPDEREARRVRAAVARAGVPGYAIDGKRLAGARRPDGSHVNLISVVDHETATTIAQREITAKTNEIPEARNLLHDVDVSGAVLTLDAPHTHHATAEAIVSDHHAAYLLTIKANQPNLLRAMAARFTQPHAVFEAAGRYHAETSNGHGRIERREIRTADATGIEFPHATQIMQIIRRSKKPGSPAWDRKEVVFAITALTTSQAGPADLARHTRGHWSVENKSHYVRDVTFGEDANQTRTTHAPANLATLRNLVIGTFRHAGHVNIAHARSLHANSYERVRTLFNL